MNGKTKSNLNYFDASSNGKYYNHSKEFSSYFISFDDDCRIEIMGMLRIPMSKNNPVKQFIGLIHLAINVGSKAEVNRLTEILRKDGFNIVGSLVPQEMDTTKV